MKKFILLILTLTVCLGGFAQFTPGDTLKYRISLKDRLLPIILCKSRKSTYPKSLLNGERNRV